MDGRNMEQQELSLTLKYLLDNPALLQPPETNNNEKCKDDKSFEQGQQTDLTSAYLGPQIWSDMLLSDDLKLEPVDLDELLDTTGLEDEMGDLSSLMASPQRPSQELQRGTSDDASQATYQDMPSLMSAHRSPDAKQVPSPSVYFHYPSPPRLGAENEPQMCPIAPPVRSPHQQSQMEANRKQKLSEMQLYDQQFAILNDILANNNQYDPSQPTHVQQQQQLQPPKQPPQFTTVDTSPQYQHHGQTLQMSQCPPAQQPMNGAFIPSPPTSQPPPLSSPTNPQKQILDPKNSPAGYSPSTSPMTSVDIRIPSPKQLNFVPNTTDVIISTPQDAVSESPFNPCTRAFSEEELKPQPIIRKSKKVHVPQDSKDGKYWNRRNKNNIAAKRSREARRIKENQIAMRANYLEQENSALKTEITELRKELTKVVEVVKKYEKKFSISR